jgi:putative acetyltransferase
MGHTDTAVHLTVEDPHSPAAMCLLLQLMQELTRRYPEEGTDTPVPDGIAGDKGAFVIAWYDDKPAGCGALREMLPGIAEVKRMYVASPMRRYGIGRKVLQKLEALARTFDYHTLCLETGTRQPEAIALYESAGFVRIACYGQYADNPYSICFEKRIRNP